MGKEAKCTLELEGEAFDGKAQLETDFLLFRGSTRLRIPFVEMKKVEVKGSELRIRFPGGLAVFELGPIASAWAQAILHPKGRIEKLGVKAGMSVAILGDLDEAFVKETGALVKSADVPRADLVFFAATAKKDLTKLTSLAKSLGVKAAVWVVYAKGKTGGKEEIRDGDVLTAGRAAGLTDIKVVRFSETHTALKFVKNPPSGASAAR